jgi:uncharacterized membrane protein
MDQPQHGWTDQQVEQFVGNLLRAGVILAAVVVLAGGIAYLVENRRDQPSYKQFGKDDRLYLRSLSGIVEDALKPDSRGVIQLGVVLLIATPIARVLFSVFAFALQRDRTYVVVTLIVLAVLLYSLLAGGRG